MVFVEGKGHVDTVEFDKATLEKTFEDEDGAFDENMRLVTLVPRGATIPLKVSDGGTDKQRMESFPYEEKRWKVDGMGIKCVRYNQYHKWLRFNQTGDVMWEMYDVAVEDGTVDDVTVAKDDDERKKKAELLKSLVVFTKNTLLYDTFFVKNGFFTLSNKTELWSSENVSKLVKLDPSLVTVMPAELLNNGMVTELLKVDWRVYYHLPDSLRTTECQKFVKSATGRKFLTGEFEEDEQDFFRSSSKKDRVKFIARKFPSTSDPSSKSALRRVERANYARDMAKKEEKDADQERELIESLKKEAESEDENEDSDDGNEAESEDENTVTVGDVTVADVKVD